MLQTRTRWTTLSQQYGVGMGKDTYTDDNGARSRKNDRLIGREIVGNVTTRALS